MMRVDSGKGWIGDHGLVYCASLLRLASKELFAACTSDVVCVTGGTTINFPEASGNAVSGNLW